DTGPVSRKEGSAGSSCTVMPSRTAVMHDRAGFPSTTTTHSWQTPMPQKTPRASPAAVRRHASSPASSSAAATVSPGRQPIGRPSKTIVAAASRGRRPGAVVRTERIIAPTDRSCAHCKSLRVVRTSAKLNVIALTPEDTMSDDDTKAVSNGRTTRGALIKAGGLAVIGASGAGAFAGSAAGAGRRATASSILDKRTSTKKAKLGVDLTFPPLQFIDPKTKKPSGYMVEITELLMKDVGATPEYVQTPFAQLFAGLA